MRVSALTGRFCSGGSVHSATGPSDRRASPRFVTSACGLPSNETRRPVTTRVRDRVSLSLLARYVSRGLNPIDGAVALTFDDGPDPVYTVAVLDELARLGVHATFFLVGQRAREHPELVRRMLADGHAVGSHSDSHPDPWRLDVRELSREYRRGRAAVESAAQQPVRLFRPPKGHVDWKGAVAMLSARVHPWRWTIDSHDWKPDVTAADILNRVSKVRAGDVVLLHDAISAPIAPSTLDRSTTCAVLPEIAEIIRGRQLRLATLS